MHGRVATCGREVDLKRRTILGAGVSAIAAGLFVPRGVGAAPRRDCILILGGLLDLRRDMGLQAVHLHPALTEMARAHAAYMHRSGRFSHAGPGGRTPKARGTASGYAGLILGEVLARTEDIHDSPLGAWVSDPETRAVLLDPMALEIGVAGGPGGHWSVVMGA